ncbi:MAG TPA: sigma-70 family RNA polymerase sigma factor, partial [Fimbriiglobus sp.]|nr:sigma-70 family RNA polymerase sigma factor [Fimbriiglobus sp.]
MTQPGSPAPVLRYLRAALGPDADGPADAELLGRFVAERDQGAFELLVWRHAGMVHRVCRAVLRDHHAAEDVAQAAFLVLARKAGSIGRRQAVAAWLYRVAYRLAVRVAVRHRPSEEADLDRLPAASPDGGPEPEAVRLLHDELARLPEKYRAPVLLCFFDGLSHADAARRLGWPVGTVAGRIARVKETLHHRLSRRGVAIPVAGLTAVAAEPTFVARTAQAAVAFAAGLGVGPGLSPTVLELAKGAIRTMTVTKLQWAAGVLAACGALTTGGVWATAQGPGIGPAGQPPAGAAATPAGGKAAAPAARVATATQRQRSLNNLKQIMLAIHNYHDAYGYFPSDIRDKTGKPLLSWRVAILPYIEQDNLYRQFKLDEPWDSEHNLKLLAQMPNFYRVGFEPKGATHTYYQMFTGPGTLFDPNGRRGTPEGAGGLGGASGFGPGGEAGIGSVPPGAVPGGPAFPGAGGGVAPAPARQRRLRITDITDGTSNTFGVVEAGPLVPWTKPADIPFDPKKPFPKLVGPFSNVLHVSMMDGSTHAIRRGVDAKVLALYVTANGGEVIADGLNKFRAPMPAVTPEEKAALRKQIAENQKWIEEIDRLMKEHSELLAGKNQGTIDLIQAEEMTARLRQIVEELKANNRQLRGEPPV